MSLTAPAGNASFRRLGRETAIYGLGVILGRAVSFLMLPVYTRYLSPADYGIIQLLDLTVDVAAIFFTAGASSGVQRFYFKTSDPSTRARLLSTTFFLVLTLSSLGALTLAALSPWIWKYGLKQAGQPWFIMLAAANFAAGTLMAMPLNFAQTTQRARLYLGISLTKLVLQLSLNILFVVVLRRGRGGSALQHPPDLPRTGWCPCRVAAAADRHPLRPAGRSRPAPFRGAVSVDVGRKLPADLRRPVLPAGRPGITAVGLYSMAYQFGFLLSQLGATPFLGAWNPHRHQLVSLPAAAAGPAVRSGLLLPEPSAHHGRDGHRRVHPAGDQGDDHARIPPRGPPGSHHPAGVRGGGLGRGVPVRLRRDRAHALLDLCNLDRRGSGDGAYMHCSFPDTGRTVPRWRRYWASRCGPGWCTGGHNISGRFSTAGAATLPCCCSASVFPAPTWVDARPEQRDPGGHRRAAVLLYFAVVYVTLLDDEERSLVGRMVRSPGSAWAIATNET